MERPNLTTKNLFILILHLIGLAKTKDLVFCESLFLTQTTSQKGTRSASNLLLFPWHAP
jgi:hypothetical protein